MPPKKTVAGRPSGGETTSAPKFPYTTRPAALRKFLAEVPRRPRPPKVNQNLLASWEIRGNDATTVTRVLKALNLVGSSNEPTDAYTAFMHAGTGPAILAQRIRETYAPLFNASLEPYKESQETLRNLFNIHSGGAPATIEYQIQTFKALCENADFAAAPSPSLTPTATGPGSQPTVGATGSQEPLFGGQGAIRIDLHIHLPENKSSRDYQYIIQDIARFIYRYTDIGEEREPDRA
jgi:hypothetical protein